MPNITTNRGITYNLSNTAVVVIVNGDPGKPYRATLISPGYCSRPKRN